MAIKIQKPDSDETVKEDLTVLRFFVSLIKSLGFLKSISTDDLINQFSKWIRQELDYRIEGANLVELGEQVKKHGLENRVRIPRLFLNLPQRQHWQKNSSTAFHSTISSTTARICPMRSACGSLTAFSAT